MVFLVPMRAMRENFYVLRLATPASYSRQGIKPLPPCIVLTAEPCSADSDGPATGFEARGFIWGAPLALALQCSFVPLRKPGKLPGKLHALFYRYLCPTSVLPGTVSVLHGLLTTAKRSLRVQCIQCTESVLSTKS